MEIKDRITEILEYSGFTASEFADEIDVQRSSLSHIASGRNKPSLEFLMKIKNRFPELNWDWLIFGKGEMKGNPLSSSIETPHKEPDLFTLIDEDYKNEISVQENTHFENSRKSVESHLNLFEENPLDSQRLGNKEKINNTQTAINQQVNNISSSNKIKKIVFFYEDGKFEAFEP